MSLLVFHMLALGRSHRYFIDIDTVSFTKHRLVVGITMKLIMTILLSSIFSTMTHTSYVVVTEFQTYHWIHSNTKVKLNTMSVTGQVSRTAISTCKQIVTCYQGSYASYILYLNEPVFPKYYPTAISDFNPRALHKFV